MTDTSNLGNFFVDEQFGETDMAGLASTDEIFSILEALEGQFSPLTSPLDEAIFGSKEARESPAASPTTTEPEPEPEPELPSSPTSKRRKPSDKESAVNSDEQHKISHITVERNRRKQMNEHLTLLRTIMPCFYVKRGDQASIVGGVVDYITELQQVLQSLEAKKQRKVYNDIILSPRVLSSPSPRPSQAVLSPRKPPLSLRPNLPISPRTPQPQFPYKPAGKLPQATSGYNLISPTMATTPSPSSSSATSSVDDSINELVVNSKSDIAEVEVKFSGPNLVLKTVSPWIPGQAMKIISTLEELSLEILRADISAVDETTMVNSFTIKIGIGCRLSAEELAQQIQQTFCS